MGNRWGGMEMRGSVYGQPGTRVGLILLQQGGFQVSKEAKKGEQKGNQQGEISNRKAPHVF
jgi:hypothetical protein